MTAPGQGLTCPSAPATAGAQLIGVRGPQGRIVPLRTALPVDAETLATLRAADTPPETRMRFASPCLTTGCAQWTGKHCGVIARVMDHLGQPPAPAALPPCTIRASCRWFAERAGAACGVCDLVVTDTSTEPA